ncbi:ATP synthase subunit delta [Gammaproteobacteria bacterium]
MAVTRTTLARPYAQGIFAEAQRTGTLGAWSGMLGFLSMVLEDPGCSRIMEDPRLLRSQRESLLLDVSEGHLDEAGANLVRLLVRNGRVGLLSDIAGLYEGLRKEAEGKMDVVVCSAYRLSEDEKTQLARVLKQRLGREILLTEKDDPALIGGVVVRAGDWVIDGSVRGRLQGLANELAI